MAPRTAAEIQHGMLMQAITDIRFNGIVEGPDHHVRALVRAGLADQIDRRDAALGKTRAQVTTAGRASVNSPAK